MSGAFMTMETKSSQTMLAALVTVVVVAGCGSKEEVERSDPGALAGSSTKTEPGTQQKTPPPAQGQANAASGSGVGQNTNRCVADTSLVDSFPIKLAWPANDEGGQRRCLMRWSQGDTLGPPGMGDALRRGFSDADVAKQLLAAPFEVFGYVLDLPFRRYGGDGQYRVVPTPTNCQEALATIFAHDIEMTGDPQAWVSHNLLYKLCAGLALGARAQAGGLPVNVDLETKGLWLAKQAYRYIHERRPHDMRIDRQEPGYVLACESQDPEDEALGVRPWCSTLTELGKADVDGDGQQDLIVGSSVTFGLSHRETPSVFAISLQDGHLRAVEWRELADR